MKYSPLKASTEPVVPPKTRPDQKPADQIKKKPDPNRSRPPLTGVDQNWIEDNQRIPAHRPFTGAASDGNSAMWVTMATERPGFLFPVSRTTPLPPVRRRITEEASLSISEIGHQVNTYVFFPNVLNVFKVYHNYELPARRHLRVFVVKFKLTISTVT